MTSIKRLFTPTRLAILLGLAALVTVMAGISAASAEPAVASPLSLRHHVTVEGGSVRLGDMFDGLDETNAGVGGETVVAYAPQPGRRAIFDANWLSRIAQRLRLNWRPTTRLDRVVVERASTTINAEDIRNALREEIKASGNTEDFDLELANRNLVVHIDANLPATIEVVQLVTEPRRGKFSAVIAVPAGDPQARRVGIEGRLFAMVEAPVPNRALRPGSIVRSGDIVWTRVRANRINTDIVTDPKDIAGQEVRRPLRANGLVRRSDLQAPITVSKGMLVTMIFSTPSMTLTASGRALEAGSTGDFITVRNIQTKTTVDARILGPNRVEVAALRQVAASEGKNQ